MDIMYVFCIIVGVCLGIGISMLYLHAHQAKAIAAVATIVGDVKAEVAEVKAKV